MSNIEALMADANRVRIAAAVIRCYNSEFEMPPSAWVAKWTDRYLAALGLATPREVECDHDVTECVVDGELGYTCCPKCETILSRPKPPSPEIPDGAHGTGKVHSLKIWTGHLDDILSGEKWWELRINDRHFCKGDRLRLREWIPSGTGYGYTGRETTVRVVDVWDGLDGLDDDYCVMSIAPIPEPEAACVGGVVPAEEMFDLRARGAHGHCLVCGGDECWHLAAADKIATQRATIARLTSDLANARSDIVALETNEKHLMDEREQIALLRADLEDTDALVNKRESHIRRLKADLATALKPKSGALPVGLCREVDYREAADRAEKAEADLGHAHQRELRAQRERDDAQASAHKQEERAERAEAELAVAQEGSARLQALNLEHAETIDTAQIAIARAEKAERERDAESHDRLNEPAAEPTREQIHKGAEILRTLREPPTRKPAAEPDGGA